MARGTGLAGGIFQGILASEQIKDKAEERKMRQGLVLSQLESAKVDREVKGLQIRNIKTKKRLVFKKFMTFLSNKNKNRS